VLTKYAPVVSEAISAPWVEGGLSAAWGLTLSGASTFNFSSGGASYVWTAGAAVDEAIGIDGSLGVNQVLKHILAQQFGLTDALYAGIPVAVSDAAEFTDSLTTVLGALIAERLALVETNAPGLTYKQTLLEYLYILDGLAKFLSDAVMESFGIAPSYSAVGVGVRTTAEAMAIATAITPKFVAVATVPESLVLADDDVLRAIFYPIISEEITFDLGVIEPNGGFTTWTVNTRTGATTEYQNYAFNSFAQSGHRYLGASATGLYVLDGDSDDGVPTVATLRSGYAQFGGSRFSSIKAAYLGIHGTGDVYLRIEDSTGGSSTYHVLLQNYETTKCRVGKGLRARYFAWELTTTGQDFDLDSVEFVPLVAQRRV
jgi:hypothetical protein